MLIVVSVFTAVVAVGMIVTCSFGAVFFEQNRLQGTADEIALAGSRVLNENDRIGEMNNMLARCRQLVYSSRQDYSQVDSSYEHLRNLASQLVNESRESASTLEHERSSLAVIARNEAEVAMHNKFNELKNTYPMSLPWLQVGQPQIELSQLGKLQGVQCNVAEVTGFDTLSAFDHASGFLHIYPDLNLYKEHSNARLPGSDSDLNFKLSSLPAAVGDKPPADAAQASSMLNVSVAPARAVLASKFAHADSDDLPSACQVKLLLRIGTGLGAHAEATARAVGSAAATGGNVI